MNCKRGCVVLLAFWMTLNSCHLAISPHADTWDSLSTPDQRARLINDAREMSRARTFDVNGRRFPFDCSGYVGAILLRNGIDVFGGANELDIRGNGVQLIREFLLKYGTLFSDATPQQGDLIFFSNTYDRNRDGRRNDSMTHIGIVESVDADGTVTFLNLLRHGIRRNYLNLARPNDHEDGNGKIINSYLRRSRRRDRSAAPVLAGALFSGYGNLVPSFLTQKAGSFSTGRLETDLPKTADGRL